MPNPDYTVDAVSAAKIGYALHALQTSIWPGIIVLQNVFSVLILEVWAFCWVSVVTSCSGWWFFRVPGNLKWLSLSYPKSYFISCLKWNRKISFPLHQLSQINIQRDHLHKEVKPYLKGVLTGIHYFSGYKVVLISSVIYFTLKLLYFFLC